MGSCWLIADRLTYAARLVKAGFYTLKYVALLQ
jgi:hypothetical protein